MHDGVDPAGHYLYPAFPYNHYTHVSDADVAAIYAFLMTRQPVTAATPQNAPAIPAQHPPDHGARPGARCHLEPRPLPGRGLGHCQACHSPHNSFGAEQRGHAFTGGLAEGWDGPA